MTISELRHDDLYTVREIYYALRRIYTERAIRLWFSQGKCPANKLGRFWLVRGGDFKNFFNAR